MKTPVMKQRKRAVRLSSVGEFGLEAGGDRRRHEGGDVAAHGRDLAHQCGGDRADRDRGRQEHRLHLRRHGLVHARDLHLVVEVGAVAQAADHDGGAGLLRRRDRQIVIGGAVERAAGLGGDRAEHLPHHRQPLLGRKQRLLAGMDADRDDQPVAQADGVADHVEMAIGDGVERAGIERDTGHMPRLARPGRPGKPDRFPTGPAFYFRSANEPIPGPRRLPGEAGNVSSAKADETKPGSDETIFGLGEDSRKLRWLQVQPTKRRAAKAHDRGPS